jgi:hypothetical protein
VKVPLDRKAWLVPVASLAAVALCAAGLWVAGGRDTVSGQDKAGGSRTAGNSTDRRGPAGATETDKPRRPDAGSGSERQAAGKVDRETPPPSATPPSRAESESPASGKADSRPAVSPDDPEVRKRILAFDAESNAILRRERLAALERDGDAGLPAITVHALADRDPTVVIQSAQVLQRRPGRDRAPLLLAALQANRRRPDGYGMPIRIQVLGALGACGDGSAVDAVVAELERHEDLSVDNAAAAALGAIGDPRAADALDRHLARLEGFKPTEAIALGPWRDAIRIAREARQKLNR